jgi:hypothetical protein
MYICFELHVYMFSSWVVPWGQAAAGTWAATWTVLSSNVAESRAVLCRMWVVAVRECMYVCMYVRMCRAVLCR